MSRSALGKQLKDLLPEANHELPFLKRKEPLDKRFQEYHEANPHVFELLVYYAMQLKMAGKKNYGIKALAERVRWHVDVETQDESGFKINNSYLSRYSRKIEKLHPEFLGFFTMRKLRS